MDGKLKAFEDLILAGMKDAIIHKKMSQFQVSLTPQETGKEGFLRIIIVPEEMEYSCKEGFEK